MGNPDPPDNMWQSESPARRLQHEGHRATKPTSKAYNASAPFQINWQLATDGASRFFLHVIILKKSLLCVHESRARARAPALDCATRRPDVSKHAQVAAGYDVLACSRRLALQRSRGLRGKAAVEWPAPTRLSPERLLRFSLSLPSLTFAGVAALIPAVSRPWPGLACLPACLLACPPARPPARPIPSHCKCTN